MCVKLDQSPIKGAGATAGAGFFLNAGQALLGHHEKNKAISNRNREKLRAHELKRWQYHRDYRDRVWAWGNENINREIAVDKAFQESIEGLADSQLKVWQSLKEGTIAEQEAFAAMMSVGSGSGQTGARSAVTTNRRAAVLAYGAKMNEVAAARSGGMDAAMVYADKVRNRFAEYAKQKDVESGTSRPVYGAPPPVPLLEEKASIWSTMFQVGQHGLSAWKEYDQLKAPEDNSVVIPEQPTTPTAPTPKAHFPQDAYNAPVYEGAFSFGNMFESGFFDGGGTWGDYKTKSSDKYLAKGSQVTFGGVKG